jgi:hypothetical protein
MWLGIDFQWIDVCDELWVYMQKGWKESYGVSQEVQYAESLGKTVRYLDAKTYLFVSEKEVYK